MSDEKLWDEEEPFNDVPDEVTLDDSGQPKQAPAPRFQRPVTPPPAPVQVYEEAEEEVEETSAEEEEEDFTEVLSDASLRLEQGNLYKLIMNSNLFDGVEADPKAIQNVQKQVRKFAKEQMEIMLGMRRETAIVEHLDINFPLNALELEILKKLAFAATKGASEHADAYVPEVTRTTEEVPVVNKKMALNPIRGNTPKKLAPKPKPQPKRALPSKPAAPVKRSKLDQTIDQIAREEGIPRELLEENLPGLGGKPLHEMSENEILERNRLAAQRLGKSVPSSTALPMASYEQQEQMALARGAQIAGGTPLMSQILDAVKKMPVKRQDE
jgi:hypothetical protein